MVVENNATESAGFSINLPDFPLFSRSSAARLHSRHPSITEIVLLNTNFSDSYFGI
jgi:hypothetical protein